MNALSSIDYSRLISWTAYKKYGVLLNKTQMQKLLFMCYGLYLARTSKKLFVDDTPKAWPYGPVFPRVNKQFNPDTIPAPFSEEEVKAFVSDQTAFMIVLKIVEEYHNTSAYALSEWSHEQGGPWYNTLYPDGNEDTKIEWNKEISDKLVKEYFNKWKKFN